MTDSPGVPTELVASKYRLTRLLGRGGMGSVWEGVHVSLGTRVACKFIESEYAGSQEARERFENEARAAATLRSKHVVEVYDHGVMGDGRPYIVMEYLQGEPLDSRLDRVGQLSVAETARILQQVARALSKAHALGIVHRDLKPENVFLVWDEEDQADLVKVVDFGIAKFTNESLGISSQTRTGSLLGTPYYMSPEQARGLRSVGPRSDLWSLGVIAFQCVTGKVPFTGEAIGDLLVKICTGEVPRPSGVRPDLSPDVDAWFQRALARDPEGRFESAKEMANALSALAGDVRLDGQFSASRSSVEAMASTQASGLSNTAGALTNAALSKDTRYASGVSTNSKAWVLGAGAAVLLLGGAGLALALRSAGDIEEVAAEASPVGVAAGHQEVATVVAPPGPDEAPAPPQGPPPQPSVPEDPPPQDSPEDVGTRDSSAQHAGTQQPGTQQPGTQQPSDRKSSAGVGPAKSAPSASQPSSGTSPTTARTSAPRTAPKEAPKEEARPVPSRPGQVDLGY